MDCVSNWNPYDEWEFCPMCGNREDHWPDEWDEDACTSNDKLFCSTKCKELYATGVSFMDSDFLHWIDTGELVTDPYGDLDWCFGDDEDFICVSYALLGNYIVLHAVVNSETGSFIDTFSYDIIEYDESSIGWDIADLVGRCYEWCIENEVECPQSAIDRGAEVVKELFEQKNPEVKF